MAALRGDAELANDVLMVSPDKPEAPAAPLKTLANEFAATVSPDGRWLAYVSNHTGRNEALPYLVWADLPERRDGGVSPW